MNPRTAIDWAMDTIARSKLPEDITGDDLNRRMMELKLIRMNGVSEGSLYCTTTGCTYTVEAPLAMHEDDLVVCPVHGTNLVIQTWKQIAGKAMARGFAQAREYDTILQGVESHLEDMGKALITMRERLAEAETNLDNHRFATACEQDELATLREWKSGPLGALACRVGERLDRGLSPRKPAPEDLNRRVYFDLLRLRLALRAGRRMAVTELAADIATNMLHTTELYGE